MGERYIERTRIHRKTDRPFFIDKMPNNFLHIGMIHAVLPNPKIIDARRHPLGCCFSNFKQYYARGQNFSYSLTDMGRFYRDYVELMAHFDEVLPGRPPRPLRARCRGYRSGGAQAACVLRPALRAGLSAVLRGTAPRAHASAEQVRRPIYRDSVEAMASVRGLAGSAQGPAGRGAWRVSGGAGSSGTNPCTVTRSAAMLLSCNGATVLAGFLTNLVLGSIPISLPLRFNTLGSWRIVMKGSRSRSARLGGSRSGSARRGEPRPDSACVASLVRRSRLQSCLRASP